jgi:hypothetical protein
MTTPNSLTTFARQRRPVEGELLHHRSQDAVGDVAGFLVGLEELRAEARDARVVDAGLQLGVWIGAAVAARPLAYAGLRRERRRQLAVLVDAVTLLLLLLRADLQAVLETHGATTSASR